VFGLTLHWYQVADAVRRVQDYLQVNAATPQQAFALTFPNLTYLWLRRRDKIAQAVSWYRAIQTGEYVKLRGASQGSAGERTELVFDYARIRTYWTALRSYDNGWSNFFAAGGLSPLVVYYEDLCIDYYGSIRTALQFMGLSQQETHIEAPRSEKAADTLSLEWIAKFKALQAGGRRPHE
jgi:LPS sulfotransferase NodH